MSGAPAGAAPGGANPGTVAGIPAGSIPGAAGQTQGPAGAPAGYGAVGGEGFLKSKIYMVSSTSASIGAGEAHAVSVSCQTAADAMIEHHCTTDSKCGALYDEGFSGKTGEPDMTTCGARNTCGKGTITIQASAACYHM
jgi:hypothetical protein